jgi:subtilisin family serine protease
VTRPVRIGIIDSGVNPRHPHVGNIVGGVSILGDRRDPSYVDHLGHGTAVAALIHEKAPQAHLFAVKVFQQSLATNLDTVLRAIDWCVEENMQIINLSLGTANAGHRNDFTLAVDRVRSVGGIVVSALEINGVLALPGSLPGVAGVVMDAACPRDGYRVTYRHEKLVFGASPYPRDIPGVPRERNLQGISFAVAHVAGFIARRWPRSGTADWEEVLAAHADSTSRDAVSLQRGTLEAP